MRKWKPRGKHIIVKLDKAPTESPGGLVLPASGATRPATGVVEALGSEVLASSLVGKRVLVKKYAWTEIDGEDDLVVIDVDNVLAVEN